MTKRIIHKTVDKHGFLWQAHIRRPFSPLSQQAFKQVMHITVFNIVFMKDFVLIGETCKKELYT